jgi:thiol-disulfide isomerase/thioredoxin
MGDRTNPTDRAMGTADARPGLLRSIVHRLAGDTDVLPVEGQLARFDGATGWLNSEPLTPEGLRGRVVLVEFLTYTCINWLRTLPYVRAWADKYADAGLTVIGVHTPEFAFEHDLDNITARLRDFDVRFPIAIDNDYGVWKAFANHFWPAIYVADAAGRIRHHHFGEEGYEMTEMVIQELLVDAGATDVDHALVEVHPMGFEVAADWPTLRSPETYLGYARAAGLAIDDASALGRAAEFPPARLSLNTWAPIGSWTVGPLVSTSGAPGARIAYRFQARDVNLVMGPASRGRSGPFHVLLDGRAPGDAGGGDVAADGSGSLDAHRLYQLVREPGEVRERTIEIEFDDAGAEVYCFTFG